MKKKNYARIGFIAFIVVILAVLGVFALTRQGNAPATRSAIPSSYLMEEVARANTADKCWVAISGAVYDLTGFAKTTPEILSLCGTNATEAVSKMKALDSFSTLRIGSLKN